MLKLKILNKPKMLKLKCISKFPDVVLANFQKKEVIPTEEIQEVVADKPYDGLSKVTVQPIPSEYIIPTGFREITENGSYDISEYQVVDVFVPEKILGTKTIKENGVYNAVDDNLDGYSSVNVQTSGYDTSDATATPEDITEGKTAYIGTGKVTGVAPNYWKIEQGTFDTILGSLLTTPSFNTSSRTNFNGYFSDMLGLIKISVIDTSKALYAQNLCYRCGNLEEIPLLDFSSLTALNSNSFNYCSKLKNLGGFKNLGKAYTQQSSNFNNYTLDLGNSTQLTHESLMNVINNLYDLNLSYNVANGGTLYTQKLVIGNTNIAKLTAEEIAIATNKGWTVS